MSPKILLVEDNETNRKLTIRFLPKDYNFLVAENGKEAVELAIKEIPNLILMDLNLPVMSGWEATEILKQNEKTKHIPIIAVTAHALEGDREKALSVGCDDFETKPIDMEKLIEKVALWLK